MIRFKSKVWQLKKLHFMLSIHLITHYHLSLTPVTGKSVSSNSDSVTPIQKYTVVTIYLWYDCFGGWGFCRHSRTILKLTWWPNLGRAQGSWLACTDKIVVSTFKILYSSLLLVGLKSYTTTLEINLGESQKTGNSSTSRPSYTTPGSIHKRCFFIPQGHLLQYVHSSFIHSSQKLETTYPSLNQRMHKENVPKVHSRILLSYLKTMTSWNSQANGRNQKMSSWVRKPRSRQTWYVLTYK